MDIKTRKNKGWVNAGCGNDLRKDMLNVDLFEPSNLSEHPDCEFIAADVTQLYDTIGGGWKGIRSLYVVEHIPVDKLHDMFWSWNLCLEIGGKLQIVVPDFDLLIDYYQNNKHDYETFRIMVYELMGEPNDPANRELTPHTAVWNIKWLRMFLKSEGFEIVDHNHNFGSRGTGLYVEAEKIQYTNATEKFNEIIKYD